MSDNKDLKSKILLMRQKNFGEVINESHEKNDNEKPENDKPNDDDANTEIKKGKEEINTNKVQGSLQHEINPNISELKENLNKVAKTNEKPLIYLLQSLTNLLR